MLTLLMAVTGSALADNWVKTSPADLKTGDVVAIVDQTTGTAMSNDNGTSAPPSATAVTLNADKSAITGTMANTLEWTVTISDGKYQFATGENFLYCTNTNNGVRVGTNSNNLFSFRQDDAGTNFLFNEATSRYIGVYNAQDWRCYTSINNNIKGCVIAFYKKPAGEVTLSDPEFKFDPTSLTATIGQVFTEPVLSYAEGFDGTLTYSIDKPEVATINATTGKLTLVAAGTATVTASSAETAKFTAGKATYALSVVSPTVYDIAGIKTIGENNTGKLKFDNAQVLYKGRDDMYVKDASGAIDFYRTTAFSNTLNTGDIINGTALVSYKTYNGLPEIFKVIESEITSEAGTAVPTEMSDLADVTLAEYVCHLVTVTGTLKVDGSNYYVTDGTTDLMIYDKFNVDGIADNLTEINEGASLTATGIVIPFKNNPEIALTQLDIVPNEVVSVKISGAGYATLFYGDKNLKVPAGVKAFTCKANSATRTLESKEYSIIPAGSAVVLQAPQGTYDFVVSVSSDEKDNENMLMGYDVAATTEAPRAGEYRYFMLADDEEIGVGFFPGAKNCGPFVSGAHKAYLAVPADLAADYYTFDFADGIKGITLPAVITDNAEIYTLSGMRVKASDLKKGVYIVNGSKIVIK